MVMRAGELPELAVGDREPVVARADGWRRPDARTTRMDCGTPGWWGATDVPSSTGTASVYRSRIRTRKTEDELHGYNLLPTDHRL